MTRDEWDELTVTILAWWPHRAIPDASFDLWFRDLVEFPVGQVAAGIQALYRDGREFAPNGAQIRLKVLDLVGPSRDWGEAYRAANQAAALGYQEGRVWLRNQNVLAAETVERFGWDRWEFRDPAEETVNRAAFRDLFREVAAADRDQQIYRGIPGLETKSRLELDSGADR